MGIVGTHPAVFVRVANTGVTGYGTWKSAEVYESKGRKWRRLGVEERRRVVKLKLRPTPTPGCFAQRVRNRLKTKGLIFWQVQKSAQRVGGKGDRGSRGGKGIGEEQMEGSDSSASSGQTRDGGNLGSQLTGLEVGKHGKE